MMLQPDRMPPPKAGGEEQSILAFAMTFLVRFSDWPIEVKYYTNSKSVFHFLKESYRNSVCNCSTGISMLSSTSKRLSNLASQLHIRQASTMKEALIHKGPKVQIIDSPIPKAGPHQIVTKVVYSGSNPKDWKVPGAHSPNHSRVLTTLTGNDQNGCPTSLQ